MAALELAAACVYKQGEGEERGESRRAGDRESKRGRERAKEKIPDGGVA